MNELDRSFTDRAKLNAPQMYQSVRRASDSQLLAFACRNSARRFQMSPEELAQIQMILSSSPTVDALVRRMGVVMREILIKRRLPVPFSSLLGRTSQKLLLQLLKRYRSKIQFKTPTRRDELETFAWIVMARDNLPQLLKRQLGNISSKMPPLIKRQIQSVVNSKLMPNDYEINELATVIIDYSNNAHCNGV